MDNNTRHALASNVNRLMKKRGWSQDRLAERATISQRTVSNILNPDSHSPKMDSIEAVAIAFKIPAWVLLVPGLPQEVLENHALPKVVDNYVHSDTQGRDHISSIADAEVRYRAMRDEKTA